MHLYLVMITLSVMNCYSTILFYRPEKCVCHHSVSLHVCSVCACVRVCVHIGLVDKM